MRQLLTAVATVLALAGCDSAPHMTFPMDTAQPAYERELYQPSGWEDLDGNGCDTRADLLTAESLVAVKMDRDGCRVTRGHWADFYTGEQWRSADDVQIDHVVSLKAAHEDGAWRLEPDDKVHFANDPLNLVVTEDNLNASKSDAEPGEWVIPAHGECAYAERYTQVKEKYTLDWDEPERQLIEELRNWCRAKTR